MSVSERGEQTGGQNTSATLSAGSGLDEHKSVTEAWDDGYTG